MNVPMLWKLFCGICVPEGFENTEAAAALWGIPPKAGELLQKAGAGDVWDAPAGVATESEPNGNAGLGEKRLEEAAGGRLPESRRNA